MPAKIGGFHVHPENFYECTFFALMLLVTMTNPPKKPYFRYYFLVSLLRPSKYPDLTLPTFF
jgi:hypothetical protein